MLLNGLEPLSLWALCKVAERKAHRAAGIGERQRQQHAEVCHPPADFDPCWRSTSCRKHGGSLLEASSQWLADPKGWLAPTQSKHVLKFKTHRCAVANKHLIPTWHLPWECLHWGSSHHLSRDVVEMRTPLRWSVHQPIWHPQRLDWFLSVRYYMSHWQHTLAFGKKDLQAQYFSFH